MAGKDDLYQFLMNESRKGTQIGYNQWAESARELEGYPPWFFSGLETRGDPQLSTVDRGGVRHGAHGMMTFLPGRKSFMTLNTGPIGIRDTTVGHELGHKRLVEMLYELERDKAIAPGEYADPLKRENLDAFEAFATRMGDVLSERELYRLSGGESGVTGWMLDTWRDLTKKR
jgi:hypothetical protein